MDGIEKNRFRLNSLVIAILLIVPLVFLCIPSLQASSINDSDLDRQHVTTNSPVLIAGGFHYFDVTLASEAQKVIIIAYHGDSAPNPEDRSSSNYYRWEYDQGVWKDVSGYDTSYLTPSKCSKENKTYIFYLGIDNKAKPGRWTIKVVVDDEELSTTPSFVIVSGFNFFLSSVLGLIEQCRRDKKSPVDLGFICSNRKRILADSEKNIEEKIDEIINRQKPLDREDKSNDENLDIFINNKPSFYREELVKTTSANYQKSKLKNTQNNFIVSNFLDKDKGGKNGFWSVTFDGNKRLLALIITIVMLSAVFTPIIVSSSNNGGENPAITIINVQSYPVIGGTWTVMFTTIGNANLTITAVNGTTWSNNNDSGYDINFVDIKRGNETLDYEWVNDSMSIANFSSNETCYKTSKVLTSGVHVLMFQFGDAVVFANNLAGEYWLQTSTSDFNNGTKNNVNVSNNAFHLNETYYIRNYSQVDNESFEGSWPPNSWSATGSWNKESDVVRFGGGSADFDGSGGGGVSGDLLTPLMNCSGSDVTAIYVTFWGYEDSADNGEYYLDYYDGSVWDQITRLDEFGSGAWANYTQKITDSQYFVSNFQIRWRVVGLDNNEHVYVDGVNVVLEKNESGYVTSGSLVSVAYNTSREVPDYTSVVVGNSTPAGTSINTWVRAADTQTGLSSATWYTNVNQVPNKRWIQWRINLTGNQYNTPTINDVNISWYYDDEDPVSSVDQVVPYWQNSTPFMVLVSASDTGGSGLKEVALYYNYSADNSSGWSGWTLFGVNDTVSPFSWSFTAPSGDGYYRFYSIAVDNESNVENPPVGFDNLSGVDTVDPTSQLDSLPRYWYSEIDNPIDVNVSSVTDTLSGVKNVTLYYKYRLDNSSGWGSWASYGTDTSGPWQWSFNFADGNGHYAFYSIAADNASNKESPPGSPDNDTNCGYISIKPSSQVDAITSYWSNSSPITVTGQATDFSGSGLKNVTLYFYNSSDNVSWSGAWLYGVDVDPWVGISWSFSFPNGAGYYRFYSIAVDNNTNAEDFTGNDTHCGYDTSSPSSQVDTIVPYWNNASDNPLVINVTSYSDDLSGVYNITLYWWNSTDNITWSGPWSNGTDSIAPYTWNFTFSNGTGYYRFYSIANDTAGNKESIPVTNDTIGGYDTQKPTSQVDSISPYWKYESDNPITINVTTFSDDLSGVENVTLYYKYRADNSSGWGSWSSYSVDTDSPWSWSFNFPNSEGHYAFYSIAFDNASNIEDSPGTPDNDTYCGYELLTSFTDSLWSESNAVSTSLTLSNSTDADGSGTGTWAYADGQWAKTPYQYWNFTMENHSATVGPISSVRLYLKHYQTGWSDDSILIQIWNGSNWQTVRSYSAGDGPPIGDTTNDWDVMSLGIDTWNELNAAAVMIIGNGKSGGEDTINWSVDTVELRVTALYVKPVINSYNLLNSTGSKLNNATGLIDVNKEYYFSINITDENGWADVDYINIEAWYDNGSDTTTYNQTLGGNLNMWLQYDNSSGTANWYMVWPDDEAQLISVNCSETIVNSTTRLINISFKPLSQVRWAPGDGVWDTTQNTTNDVYSWNFNITVTDAEGKENYKIDEYGVYKYTSVSPDSDWVDVLARPGSSDSSNIVAITYSSNYDFNMSIYFEENLTNETWGDTIAIDGNVTLKADADPDDDITDDKTFQGIGEVNAIDIFNVSGLFQADGFSQTVDVQFKVYVPIGTHWGEYSARVATKITHD